MSRPVRLCWIVLALACAEPRPLPADQEVPVRVGTVALDARNTPVVILEEENGPRLLPIWIGSAEASSIAAEINHRTPPRPNSHDMAQRLVQQLEAEVVRVVVTELRGATFYAILHLHARGRGIEIDVRPSDGIALALRTEAPILVRASVFDEAGARVGTEPGRPIGAGPDGSDPATERLSL